MPPAYAVVDGSNIATEGRSVPSLAQLDDAVQQYQAEHPGVEVIVVVDATFGHRIDPQERPAFDEAVAHNELVSPPAGAIGRGDAFVLRVAERTGAQVLSNDSFQEFHAEHPWLFDEGRLIGGKPVPGVGWIFTARTPVRGPRSRAVTNGPSSRGAGTGRRGRRPAAEADQAPLDEAGTPPRPGGPLIGDRRPAPRAPRARRAESPEPPAPPATAPTRTSDAGAAPAKKQGSARKAAGGAQKAAEKAPAKKRATTKDSADKAPAKKRAAAEDSAGAAPDKKAPAKKKATTAATKKAPATKAATKKAAAPSAGAEPVVPRAAPRAATPEVAASRRRRTGTATPVDGAGGSGDGAADDTGDGTSSGRSGRRRGGRRATATEVKAAIAAATVEAESPPEEAPERASGGSRRRRRPEPPAAVNDPLTFLTFVTDNPVGSTVEGTVASFVSHGAMVDVGGMLCYLPLSGLGDPAPRRAREVVERGEQIRLTLVALDPPRRGAELALPALATARQVPTPGGEGEDDVEGAGGRQAGPAPSAGRRGARGARRSGTSRVPGAPSRAPRTDEVG